MRARTTALLVTSALLLAGCGAGDVISDVASGAADAIGSTASEIANGADGEPAGNGGGQAGDAGSGTSGDGGASAGEPGAEPDGGTQAGGDAGSSAISAPLDDFNGVGFQGPAMLRGSISRLIVEVDVQQGLTVTQSAVDHLIATMRQLADKPGGVQLAGGNTFASDRTEWTSAQLREAAKANRSNFSGGDTVVVYVLYTRGGFFADGEQTSAIGVAYNSSEFAVFPERWSGLSLLGSDAAIERAVLVHEWGHLLSLVNIGYTSEIDHEDAEHRGHSRNKSSVMYFAIESTLIGQVFSGAPPDSFDDADLADIEGLRSGKYRG
ncbi:MAG: hypothetical protein ACI867_002491 [Glaciecola sp.]|jgi:hypothetical protein